MKNLFFYLKKYNNLRKFQQQNILLFILNQEFLVYILEPYKKLQD